jgi:hypothetical protein
MHVQQIVLRKAIELPAALDRLDSHGADLLLLFGSVNLITAPGLGDALRNHFPRARQLGCSTAGEITPDGVDDGTCSITAIKFDRVTLTEGSTRLSAAMSRGTDQSLAILVSCVGRKLVMGSRVDEEVEAVGEVLGNNSILTGFYSYGEISPFTPGASCKLHNQTMTVTCLGEN